MDAMSIAPCKPPATGGIPVVYLGARTSGIDGALIALVTIGVIWRFKKLPEPLVVAVAAAIGLLAFSELHR